MQVQVLFPAPHKKPSTERRRLFVNKTAFCRESDLEMKEFFGFGGYQRAAEGYLSWQHLVFVTVLNVVMVIAAVALGRCMRGRDMAQRNRPLAAAALWADGIEIFKIIVLCIRHSDPFHWLYELPLFMCSIHLIAMPLAAFSRGRLREASLDFVCIFGLLGAVLGTYGAGNNYSVYPVLSLDNVSSGLTHCLTGFASLYILFAGMASMKKQNILMTFGIITGFCAVAYTANHLLDYNYMFLMRGDGTPYDILFHFLGGSPVWYPLGVLALFYACIVVYYRVYALVKKAK